MKNVFVRFILAISCMHHVFSAHEEFLKYEQLKKEFDMTRFMSLPPDPQNNVLEYLKPDKSEFKSQLKNNKFLRLQELLVSEYFYNHAKKYNKKLKENNDKIGFSIQQENSQLSKVRISYFETALHNAAMFDDVTLLSTIIEVGVDLNQDCFYCPLSVALEWNSYESVLKMLQAGVKVSEQDLLSVTTRSFNYSRDVSIEDRRIYVCNIAEQLIKMGANVNALGVNKKTPLHHAVRDDNALLVVLLLKHGANIAALDDNNVTPLMLAQSNSDKNPHIKQILICEDIKQKHAVVAKTLKKISYMIQSYKW